MLFFILTVMMLHAENVSTEWIEQKVEEIKPSRAGLDNAQILSLTNPFILLEAAPQAVKETEVLRAKRTYQSTASKSAYVHSFVLNAVLNNSAKINNQWYALNDTIGSYALKQIKKDHVMLQKGSNRPIAVYMRSKNKKIQLTTK